jgi:hypothetical protein
MSVKRWDRQVNTHEEMNKYLRVYSGVNAAQYLRRINLIEVDGRYACNPELLEYHKCVYRAYCYFHNKNNKKFNKYFNKCENISRDLMDNISKLCEDDKHIAGFTITKDNNLTHTTNEESYKVMCDNMCNNFQILDGLKGQASLHNYFN